MRWRPRWAVGISFVLICSLVTCAEAQTKRITVKFKRGSSGATYKNSVSGYGTVDYVARANAGQTMSVKLKSSNPYLYFYLGKDDFIEPLSESARTTTSWLGQLPDTGGYLIRVYLFRNAARVNKTPVRFTLRIAIN